MVNPGCILESVPLFQMKFLIGIYLNASTDSLLCMLFGTLFQILTLHIHYRWNLTLGLGI